MEEPLVTAKAPRGRDMEVELTQSRDNPRPSLFAHYCPRKKERMCGNSSGSCTRSRRCVSSQFERKRAFNLHLARQGCLGVCVLCSCNVPRIVKRIPARMGQSRYLQITHGTAVQPSEPCDLDGCVVGRPCPVPLWRSLGSKAGCRTLATSGRQ